MPHFKCVGCRTRLYSAGAPADLVGDLCPGCGSLLEPVGRLAEIVGFQSIRQRVGAPEDSPRRGHEGTAGGIVDALFARREAILARSAPAPEAIAAALPSPRPTQTP
jgi:hypothetical protein